MPGKLVAAMRRFERFEYSVITKAPPELAWQVFSDCELWPQFSELYKDIRWTKGEPWQEGSRLSIRTRSPIEVTLDHAIICCEPAEKVAWIDHALGTVLEQWVYFEPQPGGGTRVRTWAEFTGVMPQIAGRTMKNVLVEFTRTWYTRYAAACNRAADGKRGPLKKQPVVHPRLSQRSSLA